LASGNKCNLLDAGTYACVWGIIGDYVYTYVTRYPRGEAY